MYDHYSLLLYFLDKVEYSPPSQVGAAMFSFVIAIHTFSLLFLRRQWSDRTCYIILIVSWASLVLEMSIENFVLAKPKTKGPYYGVAGYWCWITAAYSTERYATSYLFIFISAVVSFILYLLVFFRLRGNISVSAGFKLDFHRRPKVRFGRTSNGTYVLTDDRRVESHFTRVAKHMLWYPLVYAILVVPQATARFCSFAGQPVPFPVTIVTTAVFLLHGFVNTMLFCTTRNILPGNWRQRLGLSTSRETQGDIDLSTRTNATWHFTGVTARPGTTVGPGGVVEKVVEIKVEETYPVPAYPKFGFHPSPTTPTTPTTPTPLLQADGDSERRKRQNRKISIFATHDVRTSIYAEEDGDDGDSDFDAGIDSTITTRTMDPRDSPQASEYALEGYESGPSITSSLQVPPPVHLVSTTRPPVDDDKRQSHSSSISTFDSIVTPAHFPRAGSPATPMSGWASEEL